MTPQELGPVLSAALVGLAIGALVAGPLADRYGRKIVLVSSVLFFGFWTLVTAFSGDVGQLVIFRFSHRSGPRCRHAQCRHPDRGIRPGAQARLSGHRGFLRLFPSARRAVVSCPPG
ncbi:MFS transporter [Azotobacter vinelandii]